MFEIMTLPYNLFKLNLKPLYYTMIINFLLLIVVSFIINRKNDFKKINIKNIDIRKLDLREIIKNYSKFQIFSTLLLVVIILTQIVLSSYLYESNAYDSFYVSWSQQAKQLEKYVENDPSTGREDSYFSKIYILNSWETFNGFIARLFNVETSSLVHTIYPIVFILISYFSYYILLKKIDNKNAKFMLLALSIIFLFSGVSTRFRGYTLLMRIWQGKTILTAIFIPYILYEMIDVEKLDKNKIILLIIANLASVAFNPIAIWLLPFIYLFFTIVMLYKRRFNNVFKMIIVIIPYLLLLPIYLKAAVNGGSGTIEVTNYVTYIDTLKDFIKTGYGFIALYILSIIYIIFKGDEKAKILYVVIPVLSLLSIANPFIAKYVQKYVTSSATYWRVFWLIPIELTISYAFVKIITNWSKWYLKTINAIICLALIVFLGKNMYTGSGEFTKHVNSEKIPQYIIDETKFILDNTEGKVVVIAPIEPLHGAIMRQLSSNIILWYSRPLYLENIGNKEEQLRTLDIYNKIYDGLEIEELYEIFNNNDIDFIIANISDIEKIDGVDERLAKIVYRDDNYFIISNQTKNR